MLAYFKDTSAKIVRVQISKCTDAIPQATPHASPRTPARGRAGGGSLRNTALAIAAPAAPKQDKMHGGRV